MNMIPVQCPRCATISEVEAGRQTCICPKCGTHIQLQPNDHKKSPLLPVVLIGGIALLLIVPMLIVSSRRSIPTTAMNTTSAVEIATTTTTTTTTKATTTTTTTEKTTTERTTTTTKTTKATKEDETGPEYTVTAPDHIISNFWGYKYSINSIDALDFAFDGDTATDNIGTAKILRPAGWRVTRQDENKSYYTCGEIADKSVIRVGKASCHFAFDDALKEWETLIGLTAELYTEEYPEKKASCGNAEFLRFDQRHYMVTFPLTVSLDDDNKTYIRYSIIFDLDKQQQVDIVLFSKEKYDWQQVAALERAIWSNLK